MKFSFYKFLSVLLIVLGIVISFSVFHVPTPEKPFYSLPMKVISERHWFYLDAQFENTSCLLALDSGAMDIVLRKEILQQIQNKSNIGRSCALDVNANEYLRNQYRINWMKIGPMKIDKPECQEEDLNFMLKGCRLNPDMPLSPPILEHVKILAGRIGMLPFRERDYWLFDFPKSCLYAINHVEVFKSQFRLPFDQFIEVLLEPSYPELIIKIDTDFGTKKFIVDTGGVLTILKPPGEDFSSHQIINLEKCAIGEHTFSLNKVYLFKFSEELGSIDGILGIDFLRNRALFLDFKNNKLFIGPQELSE